MKPSHLSDIEVIIPNLNQHLSGVTATVVRLLPLQAKKTGIVAFGMGLPGFIPRISPASLLKLGYTKTRSGKPRIWHARRNLEMLLGVLLKHVLRYRLKLVFTSASQRNHSAYTKFLIHRMDHVIATSNATAQYLEIPSTIIPHGIPVDDFSPARDREKARKLKNIPGRFVVGCFGRIRKQKGTDVFVDAMIRVVFRYPHASAIILGRTTEKHQGFLQSLKNKVADAGLDDHILFPGEIPIDEISDWYKTLSLFVAPQRWEGFGLTPLEAMACAVPVVATKVGLFPEFIRNGKMGFLVSPGDIEEMEKAIGRYVNNPIMAEEHGRNAMTHIHKNFDMEREAEEILNVYSLLQNPL